MKAALLALPLRRCVFAFPKLLIFYSYLLSDKLADLRHYLRIPNFYCFVMAGFCAWPASSAPEMFDVFSYLHFRGISITIALFVRYSYRANSLLRPLSILEIQREKKGKIIKGVSLSPGITVGRAYIYRDLLQRDHQYYEINFYEETSDE